MSATRLTGRAPGPGSWIVPSRSQPGTTHAVEWVTEAVCFCDCDGFAHRRVCRHVEAVAHAVETETRALFAGSTAEQRAASASALDDIAAFFSR